MPSKSLEDLEHRDSRERNKDSRNPKTLHSPENNVLENTTLLREGEKRG
jgi:hypothetical protein